MQSTTSSTRTFRTSSVQPEEPKKPKRQRRSIKLPKIRLKLPAVSRPLPWILAVILLLVSLFLFQQYRDVQAKLQPTAVAKSNQQVISQLHKLVSLPSDEAPTIATVKDATKARQESPFFIDAQVGDKFIYYAKANKTILYRPSQHTIINFSTSLKINTTTQ